MARVRPVAAVKGLLQRARAQLAAVTIDADEVVERTDHDARRVLDEYIAAFERSDMAALEQLLADESSR